MLCDQVREHLSAYLDKELTADLSAAVRAHLDSCAECRALAEELRATVNLLGRLPARPAPGHLADDVMRAIERRGILAIGAPVEPQPQERMLPMRRASAWPRALAVAATVVLAVGIGIFAYLSDIGRMAAPAPESGVARKATDASKLSDKWSMAMGPAPKAAPSDPYATQEPDLAKKAAEKSAGNLYSPAAAPKKEAEGRKSGGQLLGESIDPTSLNFSLAARDGDVRPTEPAQTVALAKAGNGAMATTEIRADGLVWDNKAYGRKSGIASDAGPAMLDFNGTIAGANTYTGGAGTRFNRGAAFGYFDDAVGQPIIFSDGIQMDGVTLAVQSPTVLTSSMLAGSPGGANGLSYYYARQPAAPGPGGRVDLDGNTVTLARASLKGEPMPKPDALYGGTLVAAGSEKMPAVELEVAAGATAALPVISPPAPPVAERAKLGTLALAGRGMPSKPALTDLDVAPAARPAAPAPVAQDKIAAPAGDIQAGFQVAGAAPRRALEHRDRAMLEKTMLAVADGEAEVEQLSRAASGEALREAGNQLVLRVESPDQADRSLVELFKAAGWRPLAVDRERSALKRTEDENSRGVAGRDPSAKAGHYEVRKLVPGGVYYRATRNGENVWLVLADRDSLSRFGSRLAQAQGLTVSAGSSADFLAIRELQSQIRESQSVKAVPSGRRFSVGKDSDADALAMNDKAPPPAAAAPALPAWAAPATASGERGKPAQKAPAAPTGSAASLPAAAPAELQQEVKSSPLGTGRVATAGRAPTPYGVEEKGGGKFGGGGGGGATAKDDLGIAKAKQEAKPQAKGLGVPAEAPAATAADRILLVIRVQPVEASRAEAVPADSKAAEKPAP
jgi:anti-sigma factor RsiW